MKIISRSVKETLRFGHKIAQKLKKGDIICLFGQLGSGKTVLAKGIIEALGVKRDKIISPTFCLIRQYQQAKFPVYHFDLYRLRQPHDVLELGYEEYLFGSGITVIEWADRLKYLLPAKYLKITLFIRGEQKRLISFSTVR
jgi:tRNA threonylcarbamoyladenosine biosynthesis protein TsaE